ncbi:suppressor protein SRP40-like [Telopea speciosissima]|uniref:suppressor protein SRP40-like n=1 Tax=Telopea speciosissima TaxID=54955 RepID=UPI001CC394BD|nr:suppressor protein SRP40-like [Telopea speciosissima]
MDSFCNQQNNHGIMVDGQEDDHNLDSISSSSSSSDVSSNSNSSSLSDFMDDATTTESSSSSASSSSSDQLSSNGPLYKMSSLMQQLPFKKGLSKYFEGKSQSFTSLSNVRSLEDLAKPENPYNKKLKSCKSYGGLSESHQQKPWVPRSCNNSKIISKKTSRGSCYAANMKRSNSFLGNSRPPARPQSTNSLIA